MTLLDALAIGMVSLSVLLMVQQSTGRFAMAGWVAGAFALGNGVSAGVQGRLIDRYGPSRVLAPVSVGCAVLLICLVALTEASAPSGLLVATAALGGLSFFKLSRPCGACGRSWSRRDSVSLPTRC